LPILTYNLHLESRSDDNLRLAQLNEVLQHAAAIDPGRVLIVAGDLNLNASKPQASELLSHAGFREAVPTAGFATTPHRHLLEPGHHIDWAFVRGSSQPNAGKVLKSVKASDHYPISFELRLSGV
jgi:endonuclease/exonuclease/phosphatase family metal-dependent hydrolase